MSKQTAVEWLYELSKERELDKFDLEQAKEMFEQQIIDAYKEDTFYYMDAQDYYNETYK